VLLARITLVRHLLMILLVIVAPAGVWGQPTLTEGRVLFAEHCAACHGAEARSTSRGRELAARRRLVGRSTRELAELILSTHPLTQSSTGPERNFSSAMPSPPTSNLRFGL
jgi:mono/diheme cytochrome c family protein